MISGILIREDIMKRSLSILIMLVSISLLNGCIEIKSSNPANGATDIDRKTAIKITFNMDAYPATVNTGTFLVKDSLNNPVEGTVTYSNKVAVFTPRIEFSVLTSYNVTITKNVKDFLGWPMKEDFTFEFTTRDGAWGSAQSIDSEGNEGGKWPEIVMDGAGNAIVIWHSGTDGYIWSARYTYDIGWSAAEIIGSGSYPKVAMNKSGNAIAVWSQSEGTEYQLWTRHYTVGIGWGTGEIVESNNEGFMQCNQVVMDGAGNAFVVGGGYIGTDYFSWVKRYTAGSGWGMVEIVGSGWWYPRIAMNSSGNAMAVLGQSDGANYQLWARYYNMGFGWGTEELIDSNNAGGTSYPQVVMDDSGNALVIWRDVDAEGIWARLYTEGSGWDAEEQIETMYIWAIINVGMDSSGNAMLVWRNSNGVWAKRYAAGLGWDTAEIIGSSGLYPGIAMNSSGYAMAVWVWPAADSTYIYGNRYIPVGSWGIQEQASNDDNFNIDSQACGLKVAIDQTGNAVAVWRQMSEEGYKVWANRFE